MFKSLPFDIKIKYNMIVVDGSYQAILTVVSYENIQFLKTISGIFQDTKMQITFHVKKQISSDFLKRLATVITTSGSEIRSINSNQIDSDIIKNNKKEAEEIKKKIQIDEEQVFLVETYIKIYAENESEIISKVKNLVNKLYIFNMTARPCNFRQKEAYEAMFPLARTNKIISKYTENIFTSESLAMIFPFFSKDIYDSDGIILGKANNRMCRFSLLADKNLNYNMCVFGSSGAGKSYYIKLNILRNLYKGINQIIIDPEGEYVELVKYLGGKVYTIDTYNPLYIEETYACNNSDFLIKKINNVVKYLKDRFEYSSDKNDREKIQALYYKYGITNKKESLYISSDKEKIYIKSKYKEKFPTLKELLELFAIKNDIEDATENERTSNLICIHVKATSVENIKQEMKLFMPKIYELIKEDTLIYFDEIWKCISMGTDKSILEEIYNMFKTLRKKKAGIISISQDIGDLFSLDNGNLGKSILNNSYTKVFFKLEYSDTEKLTNLALTEELVKNRVFGLERGSAYIKQGNSNFMLQVRANKYEEKLIKGECIDEENISSNK